MAGLAAALDADAYLFVKVEPAGFVPTASRVSLEPLSSDDWEILEANAEHLEGRLLTQARRACSFVCLLRCVVFVCLVVWLCVSVCFGVLGDIVVSLFSSTTATTSSGGGC